MLRRSHISRGVKAGGFNSKLNDFTPPLEDDRIPYSEEVLISYEAGGKFELVDGKLRLNSSFFYYDYQDYQAFQFTGIGGLIDNADATYYGGELEIFARPLPQLDISLSGSYLDATIKDIQIASGVLRDVRPSYTPEWSIAGLMRYRLPAEVAGGELAFQADGTVQGSSYSNTRNFDAEKLEGYGQLNASIRWENLDNGMTLTAFVKNIFDKRYEQSVVDIATLCGCAELHYSDPRMWGIRLHIPFR